MTKSQQTPKRRPGMIKRGVQKDTIDKVAAQVQAAESATTQAHETKNIALSNINIWEEQPRTFKLTIEDVIRGYIVDTDSDFEEKTDELEGIASLALSIKEFGLWYSPIAYALPGKRVQLIGGQRRTMASIFALLHVVRADNDDSEGEYEVVVSPVPDSSRLDNERIAVKVFTKKPDEITMERISVADNTQRSDLSISDRLSWAVKFANKLHERGQVISWRDLSDTLALSRSQAFEWKKIIDSRSDHFVSKAISLVIDGTINFKRLNDLASAPAGTRKAMFDSWFKKSPAPDSPKKVSLGGTTNYSAIKRLIMTNINEEQKKQFADTNWDDAKQVKQAFSAFLTYWESIND